nr:lateral organ boundaries domain protein 22 [Ipomoea batatas]
MGLGRRHNVLGPAGTLNTVTPCAACKLLRRRCAQECPFSPYFSPLEPHKFASVHKVFGASNVSKMLMDVPESLRADAANSLVYEANLRLRDPVYGCMGTIIALQQQVQALQAELNEVRAEIMRYKFGESAANIIIPSPQVSFFLTSGAVSIAAAPPPLPPPPPPLPPPVLLPRSSSFSLYTPAPPSAASDNADFGLPRLGRSGHQALGHLCDYSQRVLDTWPLCFGLSPGPCLALGTHAVGPVSIP